MSNPVRFDALLEPLVWGRNTYTIIRVPPQLALDAARAPSRRIEGSIEGLGVNLGLNKADPKVLIDTFVYVGAGLQRRLRSGPGDVVTCDFEPADPDLVPLPGDVAAALAESGCTTAWDRRTPSERRQLLMPIENAAREHTRAVRIERLIASLESR